MSISRMPSRPSKAAIILVIIIRAAAERSRPSSQSDAELYIGNNADGNGDDDDGDDSKAVDPEDVTGDPRERE